MEKTIGIVLKVTPYKDNDFIVKIFTQHFGNLTFIIHNVKSAKSKAKAALFQPFSVLQISFQFKKASNIQQLKEVSLSHEFLFDNNNMSKNALLYFVNEVVYKTLMEEEQNENLFNFLLEKRNEINEEKDTFYFSILFLIEYSYYIGIYPTNNFSLSNPIFDLREGKFVQAMPTHPNYCNQIQSQIFHNILNNDFTKNINREIRNSIVQKLILYYQIHLPDFGILKSLTVLNQVFDE